MNLTIQEIADFCDIPPRDAVDLARECGMLEGEPDEDVGYDTTPAFWRVAVDGLGEHFAEQMATLFNAQRNAA